MKIKWALAGLMLASTGCSLDNSRYYQVGGPPTRPATWYPLDFPVCHPTEQGGAIVVPLKIRIWVAGLPYPERVMAFRQKDPKADGCSMEAGDRHPVGPRVVRSGTTKFRGGMLDMLGNGFAASSYTQEIVTTDQIKTKEEGLRKNSEHVKAQFGSNTYHPDLVLFDEKLVINGMEWRHTATNAYSQGAEEVVLGGGREMFQHAIDENHVYQVGAYFSAELQDNKALFDSRRQILRRLVESVRIQPVSQEEMDAAIATDNRERAIDEKCRSNERCRAKGITQAELDQYQAERADYEDRFNQCKGGPKISECMNALKHR
jgi:hypothetical protein